MIVGLRISLVLAFATEALVIIGYVLDRLVVFATRRLACWERGVEL